MCPGSPGSLIHKNKMYLALARKYRPQQFKDLIGQPHITKTLQNAIELKKLYPALIFSGMKGVGKTSAARILAKALNCEKGPASEPCNECDFCVEITQDKSPDYIEIDGASNNGIEEIRNLKEKVKYKPLKNRYRIIVIDEVHMLSNSAWNALLKTVEEPPELTYFIMATTDFHKIPATIVSRCQHFEFKRIPCEIIIALLKEISQKEKIKISDYSLFLISKAGEGSLRDSKKILDQSIAISCGDVKDKDVIDILGIIEEEIFINLTRNIFTTQRRQIIEQVNDLSERGVDLRFFYGEYLKFFRDLLILKSLENSEKLHNLNPENIPQLNKMLENIREIELLRYFNAAKDLEQTMRHTENPRIILEYLFLKLSYFPSLITIEELIQDIKTRKGSVNMFDQQAPTMVHSDGGEDRRTGFTDSASQQSAVQMSGQQAHTIIIDFLKQKKPRIASALNASKFYLEKDQLIIEFTHDLEHYSKLVEENKDYLKEVFSQQIKEKVEIQIRIVENKEKLEEERKMMELKNDRKVNNLADTIKGQIVDIEIIKGE
jgi:DNA polymerase-3 subunit gamma/tau